MQPQNCACIWALSLSIRRHSRQFFLLVHFIINLIGAITNQCLTNLRGCQFTVSTAPS